MLVYSVLRILVFVVPFLILMAIPFFRQDSWFWVAAVCASLIGLSLSTLFLNKPLSAVSTELAASRQVRAPRRDDEDSEDAAVDAAEADTSATDTAAADGERTA